MKCGEKYYIYTHIYSITVLIILSIWFGFKFLSLFFEHRMFFLGALNAVTIYVKGIFYSERRFYLVP